MRLSFGSWLAVAVLAIVGAALVLTSFERPPVSVVQRGFRGTAMELVYNPRRVEAEADVNRVPEVPEPADTEGPYAKEAYQNVQVLGDLSLAQFGRLMQYITEWVSPEILDAEGNPVDAPGNAQRGCNYCHNPENYAEDSVYTKVVARRMLQMVKHINQDWQSHVGNAAEGGAGVTCYTCHRGHPVPAQVWSQVPAEARSRARGFTQDAASQNIASTTVGLASLPYDIFSPYFEGRGADIRVNGETPLPEGNRHSIKQTEWTYGLMMHFSNSLGVNCTHCHNSRAFFAWDQSTPQRVNAWHGINMVRDVNNAYIDPLKPVFPANRLGPNGDPLKVNCATCHQGAYKPLYGARMLRDYPELNLVATTPDLPLGTAKPQERASR